MSDFDSLRIATHGDRAVCLTVDDRRNPMFCMAELVEEEAGVTTAHSRARARALLFRRADLIWALSLTRTQSPTSTSMASRIAKPTKPEDIEEPVDRPRFPSPPPHLTHVSRGVHVSSTCSMNSTKASAQEKLSR